MSALAFTPWFVLSVKILTGAFIALLGGKLYAVLRRESGQQRQDLAAKIELLLPQTQCGQCGYEGCAPYAQALANGDAINKCPPGGTRTIASLARLLHKPSVPLDPAHGSISAPTRAWIREAECIGCTKCIQACPVDAIIGAARLMHTVIASECTGCDLCVGPCPVDCIDMLPVTDPGAPHWYFPASSRPVMLTSTGSARL